MLGDLPDVNVWLALSVEEHPHHGAAMDYWQRLAAPRCCFNRVTMLGLVRLLTQPRLMGDGTLDSGAAFAVYLQWLDLPEVELHPEPTGCHAALSTLIDASLPPRLLTDAYLASFARAAGLRLVSFDTDFERFGGLQFLHLRPGAA